MAIRVGNIIVASGGGVKGDTGENGANTVTDSTTNGNILVNGSEIVVYDDTNVKNSISDLSNNKVDKVTGKSLLADTEITRLSGISNNATKTESSTTNGNIKINGTETKVYDDSSIQTALNGKVDDSQVLTNVPSGAVFTDTVTTVNGKTGAISKDDIVALGIPAQDTNTTYSNATTSTSGLLSNTDKTKLDGITAGATNVTSSTTNGNIKVNDTETTVYTHPTNHTPSIITQDSSNRFVTDTQISTWNNKLDSNANAVSATKLANPRNINGVPFDGQSDITITDNTKLPTSYLDTTTTLGTSDVKVSTQNAVKSYVDNNVSTINSQLAEKAKQSDLLTQQGRIDNLVATSSGSFYEKTTNGTTGALLIVASGATTGQINLASVTPVATGYTPVANDYARLVYGVASGSAELIDARIGADGIADTSLGTSTRRQFGKLNENVATLQNNIVNRYQYIIKANCIWNKRFTGASLNATADAAGTLALFPFIEIKAGDSVYFKNISGLNTKVFDSNGTLIGNISTNSDYTGIYTASQDVKISVTLKSQYFSDDSNRIINAKYLPSVFTEGFLNTEIKKQPIFDDYNYHVQFSTANVIDVDDLNYQIANGIKNFVFPSGMYIINKPIIISSDRVAFYGNYCHLSTDLDIPFITANDNYRVETFLCKDLIFNRVPKPTHYHVEFNYRAYQCKFINCVFYCGDYPVNRTDKAGLYIGNIGHTSSFVNWVENCWFNGSKLVMLCDDSYVLNNILWGYTLDCALDISSANNIYISGNQIIGSDINGGIYSSGASTLLRITNNELDGNNTDTINSGNGINLIECSDSVISDNSCYFWSGNGFKLTNCTGLVISDNNFYNNDKHGGGTADILFICNKLNSHMLNVIKNNTFKNYRTGNTFYCIHISSDEATCVPIMLIDGNVMIRSSTYTDMIVATTQCKKVNNIHGTGGFLD